LDIEAFSDLATRQRAIRKFDHARPVDDALIERIVTAGTHAPSGGNRQHFRFVVVRDAEVKRELSDVYTLANARYGNAAARTAWSDAPVLIVACSQGGTPPSAGSAGAAASRAASVLPAVQNMLLAITALGLGSVLTTLWKDEEPRVKAVLGLPDDVEVHAILPVGWPDRKYGRNHRKPMSEVTYRDRFGVPW